MSDLRETHLGFGEYDGQDHLYDGHVYACESGTADEIVSYLKGLKDRVPSDEEALTWQGENGFWFAGSDAIDAIDAELSRVTEGKGAS